VQYILLIYSDESRWEAASPQEIGAMMEEYGAYSQALHESGAFVAGEPLKATATATTVRVREGETLTTDGPFAETKEQLGGFYIVDVESLDEALEWAAKVPSARVGSIEVRPILPIHEMMPQSS
jgi:hypothetical protein